MNNLLAIINASPLMYLGKIGSIQLLPQLFSEVWTCDEVKEELLGNETAPEIPVLENAFNKWLQIHTPQNKTLVEQLTGLQLHPGEAAVIALANELIPTRKPILIIDDSAAREIARTLNLPLTGTIGILLKGVKNTLISAEEFRSKLHHLIAETDFRLSIKLYVETLKKLKELEKRIS
ncbi:MAG: DUF3368 domain-containing protein [Candidatus Helarchaeota archaeon]